MGETENLPEPTLRVDTEALGRVVDEARRRQRFVRGFAVGVIASLAGAAAWAFVADFTGHRAVWMSIGVGALVGFAVRRTGKGIDTVFAWTGAALSLVGCLAGSFLAVCAQFAADLKMPFWEFLRGALDRPAFLMKETFEPIDALFYAFAVWAGFRLSRRGLTEQEISRVLVKTPPA